MSGAILLNASAAASCPVKTQHAFTPVPPEGWPPEIDPGAYRPDPAAAARLESRREHRRRVLDRWLRETPGAVDLRGLADEPTEVRVAACRQEVAEGRALIVGGTLPPDPGGGRLGVPGLLLRGSDRAGGQPGYYPVVVKWHRIIHRVRPPLDGDDPPEPLDGLQYGTLGAPGPDSHPPLCGFRPRVTFREHDFLQLAHYVRMLAAAGWAAPGRPWAGVIGTDEPPPEIDALEVHPGEIDAEGGLITWADLAEPVIRTAAPTDPRGFGLRSLLDRYDAEHRFRLAIAGRAAQQTGHVGDPPLLVEPVVNDECAGCPWWNRCRSWLDADDLSLKIERGRLDAREIIALRRAGVATVSQLAAADLDELLDTHRPRAGHRPDAEPRLRTAARRAHMLVTGTDFERETSGAVEVPAAELEIDVDLESAFDGRIYLWGFRVQAGPDGKALPPYARQFATFADLDADAEIALAREALGWLRNLVEGPRSVRVYHYSGFEVAMVKALAARSGDEVLGWAADYAEREFVDLLEVIKTHYFGVSGLGLKSIARHAGFRWRDTDPGGLNSQVWFAEAVHGATDDRELARRRVLQYNEDDVAATAWLRAWLRAQ